MMREKEMLMYSLAGLVPIIWLTLLIAPSFNKGVMAIAQELPLAILANDIVLHYHLLYNPK